MASVALGSSEVIGNVSVRSVVKAALALLAIGAGILCVIFLQRVIVLFLLALFLSAVMEPGVTYLRKWGIRPGVAVLFHYALFLAAATYLLVSLVPVMAQQMGDIIVLAQKEAGQLITERRVAVPFLSPSVNVRLTMLLRLTLRNLSLEGREGLAHINTYLTSMTAGSIQYLTGLAGSVLNFLWNAVVVLVFAFFVHIERTKLYYWFRRFLPRKLWSYADERSSMVSHKLSQWVRGQLLLCLSIGLLTFLVLVLLRMPYALTLAMLAGFTEFIPYVGPLFGAIPAILIALAHGGFMWALVVALAYYLIQLTENNLLVPLIMKRSVEISAVAIMFAMLVGVSFPGVIHPVLGILLSIPMASILGIFLEDVRKWQRARRIEN